MIHAASLEKHAVFDREHNLRLQPGKCEFFCKEVIWGIELRRMEFHRILQSAVKEFTKKIKEIQAFIGLAGFYRKFIDEFSKIAKPLTKLLCKGAIYKWSQEQQYAFEILKNKLSEALLLAYPDCTKKFIVTMDAVRCWRGVIAKRNRTRQANRVRKNIK